MILFKGKQTCSKCGKEFEWNGYKLKNGEAAFSPAMILHQVSDITSKEDGSYVVIVHCPTCGHKDNADGFVINES